MSAMRAILGLALCTMVALSCKNARVDYTTRDTSTSENTTPKVKIAQRAGEVPAGDFFWPQSNVEKDENAYDPVALYDFLPLPFHYAHLQDPSFDADQMAVALLGNISDKKIQRVTLLGSLLVDSDAASQRIIIALPQSDDKDAPKVSLMRHRLEHPKMYHLLEEWLLHYDDRRDARVHSWSEEWK